MSRRPLEQCTQDSAFLDPVKRGADRREQGEGPVVLADPRQKLWLFAGLATVFIFGVFCFWWICARNPQISFLSGHPGAEWIVFPRPAYAATHPAADSTAVFRQTFQLGTPPANATLVIRALKHFEVTLNGAAVGMKTPPPSNWKDPAKASVAGMLRAGGNEIDVTVINKDGPPALWLELAGDNFRLGSDGSWNVSVDGGSWHQARLASAPPPIEPDNPLFSKETPVGCFLQNLRLLLLFAVIASGFVLTGSWYLKRAGQSGAPVKPARLAIFVLALTIGCWIALYAHNLGRLPVLFGFDVDDHLDYINFIKTHHSFPLANQGREMYNPPLYYALSAGLAGLFQLDVFSVHATEVFRGLGLVVGIAHLILIYLCLRLLFPQRLGLQLSGLILAAFLPEHLYMSQYVTNECLSAFWVTAAVYFCLRQLTSMDPSWKLAAACGACLDLALLTKITAIIAVPFFAGALGGWLLLRRIGGRGWLKVFGMFLIATFAICSWHYLRVWEAFGTPFVVSGCDAISGIVFWVENGYRNASFFLRFGQCLTHPFFSAFYSFGDGVYSSCWGDSLCGGSATFSGRAPWDYELIAAGMLLSLVPTALIVAGLAVSLFRFFRRPGPIWFLLLGIPLGCAVGLVYVNLRTPWTSQVKAFYCLLALLPICALGAVGWDLVSRLGRVCRGLVCVLLGVWALNAYAAYWIRGDTCATHNIRGLEYFQNRRYQEAAGEFAAALRAEPGDVAARLNLANTLLAQGQATEAMQLYEEAVQRKPQDPTAQNALGLALAAQGKLDEAIQHYRQAIEWKTDFAEAHANLGNALAAQSKLGEAVAQFERAIQLDPGDANTEINAGIALARQGNLAAAVEHCQRALQLEPDSAEAHYNLGNVLFLEERWDEAFIHYRRVLELRPDDVNAQNNLAMVLLKQGKTEEAIVSFQKALNLATANHEPALAGVIQRRLRELQSAIPRSQTP